MSENNKAIDAYIAANMDAYIQEVIELCTQPSVSATGEGTRECADLVVKILERHGMEVQKFETSGNPVIVGKLAGKSERTLLCYNHYDVQPPEPLDLWTNPPFEPTVRDGAIFARGAKDDKGEFIARLGAMDAVRDANGGELPCGITFVVEGEEEVGSPTIADFVLDHLDLLASHGSIWEESFIGPHGGAVNILGVRGILALELKVSTMNMDAHSGGAHLLPSAAWRLAWALASLKDQDEKILIDGFYENALPPSEADKEIVAASQDYYKTLTGMYREQYGLEEFLRGKSEVEGLMVFEPTCNIQGITTGYQGPGLKTVIPSEATAKLDFRLVPGQHPDEIEAKLRAHLDKHGFEDVVIARSGAMLPAKAEGDDPFVKLTNETGQEVYEKPALVIPMTGGSSPVYAFAGPLGDISVVTAGVGYWDNRTHAPDEHMRLEDFQNGMRHIGRIMEGFADLAD